MLVRTVRNTNRAILLLLVSVAALTMPHATVMCIGEDGHRAIERAGHDHCEDGSHPLHYRPTGSEAAEHSHVGRSHCRPCVDIPIPAESSDHRIASQRSRLAPAHAAGFVPAIETPGAFEVLNAAEPSFSSSSVSCSIAPLCVILQV